MLTVDDPRSDRTQNDRTQINPSLADSCKEKLRATLAHIFNNALPAFPHRLFYPQISPTDPSPYPL